MRYTETDGPRSVAFQFDHLVRALYHLLMQLVPMFLVLGGTHVFVEITQTHSGNVNSRPHRH